MMIQYCFQLFKESEDPGDKLREQGVNLYTILDAMGKQV